MTKQQYIFLPGDSIESRPGTPLKMWTRGVFVEEDAIAQLKNVTRLPFIFRHVAVMPDVHVGKGATIGSVVPTERAIIPAAVGVDLGCGMMAVKTSLTAERMPDNLRSLRFAIESAVPHGRTDNGGANDVGSWKDIDAMPDPVLSRFAGGSLNLGNRLDVIIDKHSGIARAADRAPRHLGTLGTGNHFIEVCLDTEGQVWVMLHSGSRGIGNRIGSYFIAKAKDLMTDMFIELPDKDLAYLPEQHPLFADYIEGVRWAQDFAMENRRAMMDETLRAMRTVLPEFSLTETAVNCHHNYVEKEHHFGKNIWVTRKGAVRAREGDLGIIPGSMGTKSFIVRGKGNPDSFMSCSHGAGRRMSRTEAKRRFSVEDHEAATIGVECKKDETVLDETPAAYKDIDAVMAAQSDLVDIVATLRQIVCVKG